MRQKDVILKAMLDNRDKKWWSAKDFMQAPYFVGYEASARMSELVNEYDFIEKDFIKRFRVIAIDFEKYEQFLREMERKK